MTTDADTFDGGEQHAEVGVFTLFPFDRHPYVRDSLVDAGVIE